MNWVPEDTKRCTKCGEEKPLSDFYRHAAMSDGRRPDCKKCAAAMNKKPVELTCPDCGATRMGRSRGKDRSLRCRACAIRAHKKTVKLRKATSSAGGKGYSVHYEVQGRERWRYFETREEASRFRRGITEASANTRTKDALGETYSLIRKALAVANSADLSQQQGSYLLGPLYEAEDACAALIRSRDATPRPAVPQGFCQCGCGARTSIAKATDTALGHVKGRPVRYIRGHANKFGWKEAA